MAIKISNSTIIDDNRDILNAGTTGVGTITVGSGVTIYNEGGGSAYIGFATHNVRIGDNTTGQSLTSGKNNTFIGAGAGCSNTTGGYNNFFGACAGCSNISGCHNNFLGQSAGYGNTTGSLNNFFGRCAGFSNTTGCHNNFFGESAGRTNTTATDNNFFGAYAGYCNTTGCYNNFLGCCAGHCNTSGCDNNFIGYFAGHCNTTGCHNTFIGKCVGYGNTTGSFNNFLGFYAGLCNTTGCHNNFFGTLAGRSNTEGSFNNFLGLCAGCSNTTGCHNTFIGNLAGRCNTTGDYNNFLGFCAGHCNTTGGSNNFFGPFAGFRNTVECGNVYIGECAGYNSQGHTAWDSVDASEQYNTFIGYRAGFSTASPYGFSRRNVAIGYCAAGSIGVAFPQQSGLDYCPTSNIFIGECAGYNANGEMYDNVFLGRYAGEKASGCVTNNVAIGRSALGCAVNSVWDASRKSEHNIAIGYFAGYLSRDGCYNNFLGERAGCSNTSGSCNNFFGVRAGCSNTSGSSNIFLGQCAGNTNMSGSCNIAIGKDVELPSATGNNQLGIGSGTNRWIVGDSSYNVAIGKNDITYYEQMSNAKFQVLQTDASNNVLELTGISNLVYTGDGNLGVGKTNPDYRLHVSDGLIHSPGLDVDVAESSTDYTMKVYNGDTDDDIFIINGTGATHYNTVTEPAGSVDTSAITYKAISPTATRTGQQIYDYFWDNYSKFDMDGDGVVSQNDGLVAIRAAFGGSLYSTDALISGITFPSTATRTTASAIRSFIEGNGGISATTGSGNFTTGYDVDGDGEVSALGDILMVYRITRGDAVSDDFPAVWDTGEYNVGIKTGSPTSTLWVEGDAQIVGIATIKNLDVVGITTVKNLIVTDSGLSNRNLLDNGEMMVAQRGFSTSFSDTSGHFIDRYRLRSASFDELQYTISQDSDVPVGFSSCLKIETTTAETALDTNEYFVIQQYLEAQDLQHLKYGDSGAVGLTLSFYVKTSQPGTYGIGFYSHDGDRNITRTYAVSGTDWQRVSVSIPGDTAGTINNDNGEGLRVIWHLAAGSTYTSTDSTSWGDYDGVTGDRWAYGHTQNGLVTTANATWQMTGAQLEIGSVATPFEHRKYSDELQRCKRYYQLIASPEGRGLGLSDEVMFNGAMYSSSAFYTVYQTSVPMRTTPTLDAHAGTNYYRIYSAGASETFDGSTITLYSNYSSQENIEIYITGLSRTAGHAAWVRAMSSNSHVALSAEL